MVVSHQRAISYFTSSSTSSLPQKQSQRMRQLLLYLAVLLIAECVQSFKAEFGKRLASAAVGICILCPSADAVDSLDATKMRNAPAEKIAKIVAEDITKRQALITADFTRELYSEECTFKDEVDTYPINKYIAGTKSLFKPEKSQVQLTSPVKVTDSKVTFDFKETLNFNIPVLSPSVDLSGNVELFRSDDGLIIRSVEHWDSAPVEVIKKARYFQ